MLLLRELLIIFSGNELSIGIILSNWVILEAFGCFISGKKTERSKNELVTFSIITIIFSLSLPVAIYFTRILKNILGVSIGESLGFLQILYSSFLILLPTSMSHGALFPLSCKIYSSIFYKDASSIGKVYVYEIVGTILGSIFWTYVFIRYFHSFQIAILIGILNLIILIILLIYYWKINILQKIVLTTSGFLLVLFSYLIFSNRVDNIHKFSIKSQWKGQNIVHYQNSLYGNICIVKNEEQYIFFSNGVPELIIPVPDIVFVEKFAHLPLFAHPEPIKVFILNNGAGGLINEILKHPTVQQIDYAELDPLFLTLIKKFSTTLTEYELNNEKVRIKYIDGRLFLKLTEDRYDLIFVGISNPSDLQTNRLFTKEFFSLAFRKLNEGGILVIGAPCSFTYINEELKNLNSCIFHTLKSVFPYVRVFPEEGINLFLASNSESIIFFNKSELVKRLKERDIKVNIPVARHIEKSLHDGWQEWFIKFIEGSSKKINYDFRPIGVFYSISYWNSLFAPYLSKIFKYFENINVWIFFGLSILFIFMFIIFQTQNIKFTQLGIPLSIMTTGFAGMTFSLLVIFAFQAIYGYVFSWIGLLISSFMAGSSFGAISITYFLPRIKDTIKVFIKIDLTIICFSIVLPFTFIILHPIIDTSIEFLLMKILFLLISFISGFLIGAEFPLANKIYLQNNKNLTAVAGTLYSADLIGGWFGGILISIIFLPIIGLLGSSILVLLIKLCSFVIIINNRQQGV